MAHRLKPFIRDTFAFPLIVAGEILDEPTKDLRQQIAGFIDMAEGLPEEVRAAYSEMVTTFPAYLLPMLLGMVVAMILQFPSAFLAPFSAHIGYTASKLAKQYRLDPIAITNLWLRSWTEVIDPRKLIGLTFEEKISRIATEAPESEKLWDDLRDQGWTEDRIKAAKRLAFLLPSPSDLVTWAAKEVFEPEMIEKYGLLDEVELLKRDLFYKVGMSDEMIDNYWKAHWVHPEFRTVVEMLRRTDFTEEDMYEWFRLVEIPPYWRDKLIAISYAVPTRVDVRRFWDMRTIDEARLREIYEWQGYHGKDLEDYILWTKVYVAFPDLIARYKNGWIGEEVVKDELIAMGMLPERVEEMWQTKFKKAAQIERVAPERDLTKTDITMAVKKKIMSRAEAIPMLERLGYDTLEAGYIIDARVAAAGSPETPLEFRKLVEGYRQAIGEEYKEIPDELIDLDIEITQSKEHIRGLIETDAPADEVSAEKAKLAELEYRYSQLKAAYKL